MAPGAIAAQGCLVNVVLAVACDTLVRRLLEGLVAVASRALYRRMLAGQQKPGFLVVEQDLFPAPITMAVAAIRTETTLVRIVLAVAGDAFPGRVLEYLVPVTSRAFRLYVFSREFEAGLVVIEARLFPKRLLMAVRAIGAQLSTVHIVFLVAGIAFVRSVAIFSPVRVAVAAFRAGVLAVKNEIGECVIESLLIQRYNPGGPPFVLAMAIAAGFVRFMPVEAGTGDPVSAHIFVAIDAQRILLVLLEWLMAPAALAFDICVALNDLAGHHQSFDRVRPRRQCVENNGDQQRGKRPPDQATHRSVHVHGDDVINRADHEQRNERDVKDMPERKQALVDRKLRYPLQSDEVFIDLHRELSPAGLTAQRPVNCARDALALPADGKKLSHARDRAIRRTIDAGLVVLQRGLRLRRQLPASLNRRQRLGQSSAQFLCRQFAPVQCMVDARIDEPPDDAASGHDQHACHGHGRVY